MRATALSFIIVTGLLAIATPAYACGLYGYHPQVQPEPNPWMPLIGFAAAVFGFMFIGRTLPRMSQGAIIGFLFALAGGLGIFSISSFFYPWAVIAKYLFMALTVLTALIMLSLRSKQKLSGIAKYGLGIAIGLVVFIPISNYVPDIKPDPTLSWVSGSSSTTHQHQTELIEPNTQRPTFAPITKNISESARLSKKSTETEIPAEEKDAGNEKR